MVKEGFDFSKCQIIRRAYWELQLLFHSSPQHIFSYAAFPPGQIAGLLCDLRKHKQMRNSTQLDFRLKTFDHERRITKSRHFLTQDFTDAHMHMT